MVGRPIPQPDLGQQGRAATFDACGFVCLDRAVGPVVVLPVDPFQGGDLDVFEAVPRPSAQRHVRAILGNALGSMQGVRCAPEGSPGARFTVVAR